MSTFVWWELLCSILYLSLQHLISKSYIQTAHLKPSSIDRLSGVTLTTSSSVNILDDKWSINVGTQYGSDMHISMNNSWGFHPSQPSSIQLYIQGNTSNETYYDDGEMLFVFAVNNQHFTQMISLDKRKTSYKECPRSNTNLISRNINQMIYNIEPDRYHRFCKNSINTPRREGIDRWNNVDSLYELPAKWPMFLNVINNPIDNTISYSWTDSITAGIVKATSFYTDSFTPNQGFDIYISGESPNEDFFIFSIDITYRYTIIPTNIPTILISPTPSTAPSSSSDDNDIPTTSPSDSPTAYIPTVSPAANPSAQTLQPSNIPSISSSAYPSVSPSVIPSISHTSVTKSPTLQPTNILSVTPSITPTKSPSDDPITQSIHPTPTPSRTPTKHPTLTHTYTIVTSQSSKQPSVSPTISSSINPSISPSISPTISSSINPSISPSISPTISSNHHTNVPTTTPTISPTISPSAEPTVKPSQVNVSVINATDSKPDINVLYVENNNIFDVITLPIGIAVFICVIVFNTIAICRKIRTRRKNTIPIDNEMEHYIEEGIISVSPLQLSKCDPMEHYIEEGIISPLQLSKCDPTKQSTDKVQLTTVHEISNPPCVGIEVKSDSDIHIESIPSKTITYHNNRPTTIPSTSVDSCGSSSLYQAVNNATTSQVEHILNELEMKVIQQNINETKSYDMSSTDTSIYFTHESSIGSTANNAITQFNTIKNQNVNNSRLYVD